MPPSPIPPPAAYDIPIAVNAVIWFLGLALVVVGGSLISVVSWVILDLRNQMKAMHQEFRDLSVHIEDVRRSLAEDIKELREQLFNLLNR
jgi:hypothetical protein